MDLSCSLMSWTANHKLSSNAPILGIHTAYTILKMKLLKAIKANYCLYSLD